MLKNKKTFIKNSKKLKILIPTHCFLIVHIHMVTTFSDFYEWIDFLGKISNKTDYTGILKLIQIICLAQLKLSGIF